MKHAKGFKGYCRVTYERPHPVLDTTFIDGELFCAACGYPAVANKVKRAQLLDAEIRRNPLFKKLQEANE